MTRDTRHERNVGILQRPDIGILRDPDVTGHAVTNRMLLLLMIKFERIPSHDRRLCVRCGEAVTARTIRRGRFYALKMASETGRVSARHVFEKAGFGYEAVWKQICERFFIRRGASSDLGHRSCRLMANRTVVEQRFIVVFQRRAETRIYKVSNRYVVSPRITSDYVLMNIMRKHGCEFVRSGTNRKRKTPGATRSRTDVAARADGRLVARKEIGPVTANARRMSRKISDIRITASRHPIRRRVFVTRAAIKLFVGSLAV